MITFNDFLQEALKPSVYRPMVKGWDRKKLEDIFKSSPLEKDRRAFRLFFQFPQKGEIAINPLVNAALKDLGYEVDDYKAGLAVKDRRKIKIGKVLSKNPVALKAFVEDPARSGLKEYEGVISRHPYDIAGMSTDRRGWTSCQDLAKGHSLCKFVPKDIEAGTLVAYMIKVGDRNINNPVGRVLIKPYLNDEGQTGYAMALRSYGSAVTNEFLDEVENFVSWLNRQRGVKGLFQLSPEVYQGDDALKTALVGDHSESELTKLVLKGQYPTIKMIKNPSENLQLTAIRKNSNSIIHIKNPTEKVQLEAIRDDAELIEFIENPTEAVQLEVIKKHIHLFPYIKNPTERVKLEMIKENPFLIRLIDDPSEVIQLAAVSKNPNSIVYIYNQSEKVQLEVIKKDLTLTKWFKNPTEVVQLEMIKRDPHLIKKIKNPTPRVVQLAAELKGK